MADSTEPKKETVRITLPPRPVGQPPPSSGSGDQDTVRINLPSRPPPNSAPSAAPPSGAPPRPPIAQTPLPPPPSKRVEPPPLSRPPPAPPVTGGATPGLVPAPSSVPRPAPAIPPPPIAASTGSAPPGPKKETARIGAVPAKPVEMKKTQPIVTMPAPSKQTASLSVTSATTSQPVVNEPSMGFYWTLLAVSTVILIIQIWNYFV